VIQLPPDAHRAAGGAEGRDWPLWLAGAALLLAGAALASIWSGGRHSRKARVVWTAIVVLVPVLGPAAWFVLGREGRRAG
jgi:hypothetical protein